jgi:AraC-like DNA-binding protein
VQRFRLLDAAAAAHAGDRTDWAALADELGFADQAHLIRAFTAVVGTSPATYQKQA